VQLNEVLLVGQLARDPQVLTAETTSVRLCLVEQRDGQTYKTFVTVEAYGKSSQVLRTLHEGDPVLVKGKLKWSRTAGDSSQQGALCVATWNLQSLQSTLGVLPDEAAVRQN
jgi:single-stranded DNA-binding protein